MRLARPTSSWALLLALAAGCGAPEPAPTDPAPAGALRETPELGRPRPKLLPPEAAAGSARSDAGR